MCVCVCAFTKEWCVLEACCTTLVCRLVGVSAAVCLARRRVTLTTVPRGAAVQTAVTMTMCASAACNCKTLPPHTSS